VHSREIEPKTKESPACTLPAKLSGARGLKKAGHTVRPSYRTIPHPLWLTGDELLALFAAGTPPQHTPGTPEVERAADLNVHFQQHAADLVGAATDPERTREDRQIAAAMVQSLVRLEGAAACGHNLFLPLLFRKPGRHVALAWACLECGVAALLDIHTTGDGDSLTHEITTLQVGTADEIHAAWQAYPGQERQTMSGARYKAYADDRMGASGVQHVTP